MIYGQYYQQISAFSAASVAGGLGNVYNGGPASIFMSLPGANQSLGYLFMIEFFVDSFIGLVIWAVLDPANPFISPSTAPFAIGLAYAVMIWGFAGITISTNLARDLGCRAVAAIFFGGEVFSYKNYSWISLVVNIPATFFATAYYELVLRDSLQKLGKGAAVHEHGDDGLKKYWTNYEQAAQEVEQRENAAYMKRITTARNNGAVIGNGAVVGNGAGNVVGNGVVGNGLANGGTYDPTYNPNYNPNGNGSYNVNGNKPVEYRT